MPLFFKNRKSRQAKIIMNHIIDQKTKLFFQIRKGGDSIMMKRIVDIVISSVMIILTLPFMVLITLLIKLDSFGPAIFKQMRIGINRRKSHVDAHTLEKIGLFQSSAHTLHIALHLSFPLRRFFVGPLKYPG